MSILFDRALSRILRNLANASHRELLRSINKIGLNSTIDAKTSVLSPGRLSIGCNSHIIGYSFLYAGGGICIGDNVMIAANCVISSVGHPVEREARAKTFGKEVRICNNVWIGAGSVILPGVTIGENSIVGAGSVVIASPPPNTLVAGVPAIVKKTF